MTASIDCGGRTFSASLASARRTPAVPAGPLGSARMSVMMVFMLACQMSTTDASDLMRPTPTSGPNLRLPMVLTSPVARARRP